MNEALKDMKAVDPIIVEVARRAVKLARLVGIRIEDDVSPHMVLLCGEWYISFSPHPYYGEPDDPSPVDNEPPFTVCEVGLLMKEMRAEWLRIHKGAMNLHEIRLVLALSTFSFYGVCSVLADEGALRDEVLPAFRKALVLEDLSQA